MVRSRFLMQNVILKLTDIMRIIFLFTKLKHYSVISGKVSRVGMGSGVSKGAHIP